MILSGIFDFSKNDGVPNFHISRSNTRVFYIIEWERSEAHCGHRIIAANIGRKSNIRSSSAVLSF